MKHTTLKTAIVLAAAALSTSAMAAPEIHGRLVTALVASDIDSKDINLTQTNLKPVESTNRSTLEGASRIRVSGEEKINDKLDLEYWLDYNIYLDNYDKDKNLSARNTYLGLKHKDYGAVKFGRIYTPDDDIDNADESWYFSSDLPWSYAGERTNNTIRYESLGFGKDKKTTFTLHYAMDEGKDSSDLAAANIYHDGDKVQLGASYVHKKDFGAARLMASYNVNDKWKVAAMAQHTDYDTSDNEVAVLASALYHYDKTLDLYGQVGFADNYGGYGDGEKTVASLGAVKTLVKGSSGRVRAFGALNYVDATSFDELSKADTNKGFAKGDLIRTETDGFAVEAGLRYDF